MNIFKRYIVVAVLTGVFCVIVLALVNAFNLALPVKMTTTTQSSELAVTGTGKIDVTPDVAFVDVGITVTSAPTVKEVEEKINTTNNKILEDVKRLNVAPEDIKTSNYSINPQFDPVRGTQTTTGYAGSANIRIKVRDINNVSKVVETTTAAGANQIMGVSYSVDDVDKYRDEARNKALENAKAEAKKLASNLGIKLGKVTNLVENNNGGQPIPLYAEKSALNMGGAADAGANFSPGTQTIESTVTVYFEKQ